MSELYRRLAETTLLQISDKGRQIEIVTPDPDAYIPGSGEFIPGPQSKQTPKALFTSYKLSDIDGELIQAGDKLCLIAASALTAMPSTADKIIDNGLEYAVVSVEAVQPGAIAILYKLQVRR